MTNEELIQKFNPATAGALTEADLAVLRGLTTEQIGVLAQAYPNHGHQRPYLLLHDSTIADNRQLYPLGTWQNLYNLHKFHGKKNFTAYTFKALYRVGKKIPPLSGVRSTATTGTVVDLSSADAAKLLRENFGAPNTTTPPPVKKVPQRPAAKPNPKAKTVDLAGKPGKGGKAAAQAVPNDGEEMQDFSESE